MKKIVRSLLALGAFFVVAVAVAACGGSSGLNAKDVADVAGNPISRQAFNHWMYIAEKGNVEEEEQEGQTVPVIVPTDPPEFNGCIQQVRAQISEYANTSATTLRADCKQLYTALAAQVTPFLITAYWYQGTAFKDGIKISAATLAKDFAQAKKEEFPNATDEKAFFAETGETIADVQWRLKVTSDYQKLIDRVSPKIDTASEMAYYKAHPSEFGTPAERNIKLIQTTTQAQIAQAQAALKSGKSWAAVSKQYSTNSELKSDGGVISDVESGQEEAAVNTVIFSAPLNKLEGPIKGQFGYYLVEVTKITPAVKDPFAKEEPEIKELLTSQNDQSAETKVNAMVKKQWLGRTTCAKVYADSYCSGYKAPAAGSTSTTTSPAGSPAGSSAAGTSVTSSTSSTSPTSSTSAAGSSAAGSSAAGSSATSTTGSSAGTTSTTK